MKQELYDEIRKYGMDEDKKIDNLNPVYHALDTYETLRRYISQDEALKLTEIICRNEWDKQKCKVLDDIRIEIEDMKQCQCAALDDIRNEIEGMEQCL